MRARRTILTLVPLAVLLIAIGFLAVPHAMASTSLPFGPFPHLSPAPAAPSGGEAAIVPH